MGNFFVVGKSWHLLQPESEGKKGGKSCLTDSVASPWRGDALVRDALARKRFSRILSEPMTRRVTVGGFRQGISVSRARDSRRLPYLDG